MNVKDLFDQAEGGMLSYEQFAELSKANNMKLVDLNEGAYVSKHKYDAELEGKSKEIQTLMGTISTRDTDLAALKSQLEAAGADATKLNDLTAQLQALQGKYDADSKNYKEQLQKQAYEFAVKEFAATKNFSSQAAKRDFIQSMIAKGLIMENGSILGAEDFTNAYVAENEDAFISDEYYNADDYEPDDEYDSEPKPQFVNSTPGAEDMHPDSTAGFLGAFHFTPVRPIPND